MVFVKKTINVVAALIMKEEKEKIFIKMYEKRKEKMVERGFDLEKIKEIFNKYYLNKKN